jgi:HEPN domain-containing protein
MQTSKMMRQWIENVREALGHVERALDLGDIALASAWLKGAKHDLAQAQQTLGE